MQRSELEGLDRDTLIARAEVAGVSRARILTRPELIDELLVRTARAKDKAKLERARGFFGRARDLLARVVERGLHLPDAADRIRAAAQPAGPTPARATASALPTVTLAEIYATQGHRDRAVETLRRVLDREPEHTAARTLLVQLEDTAYVAPPPPLPPEEEAAPGASNEEAEEESGGSSSSGETLAPTTHAAEMAGARETARSVGADELEDDVEGGGAREPLPPSDREGGADELEDDVEGSGAREPLPPSDREGGAEVLEAGGAREPSGMLDDTPLPAKYDVDECVAIPVDPTTLFVYWEVRDATLAYLHASRKGGVITLRLLTVIPTWDGPRTEVRDHDVGAAFGDYFLRDLKRAPSGDGMGTVVRAAIGWRVGDVFIPIAQSPALETPPGAPSAIVADVLLRWTSKGTVPVAAGDVDAPRIAHAVEIARTKWGELPDGARDSRDPLDPLGASERLARERAVGGGSRSASPHS